MRRFFRTAAGAKMTAAAVLGCAVAGMLGLAPHTATAAGATESIVCSRWAAPSGDDWSNDGSQAHPVESLGRLVAVLLPGQTGCLAAGTYQTHDGNGIIASSGEVGAPKTVRTAPGVVAGIQGEIWVQPQVHDLVLTNLTFLGDNLAEQAVHINIDGDRIQLRDSDITSPNGICVDVGSLDAYNQTYVGERADDVVIDGNRIHGCGTSSHLVWTEASSGSHGVYLINTLNTQITNNYIYDNQWRGLQLWPLATGTDIEHNVFDGNATNVNIGSALLDGYPWVSTGTTVRDNVITNSTLWTPSKNSAQVHGNFPNNGVDYGNVVTGNCMLQSDPSKNFDGFGYTQSANPLVDPQYVNRAAKDFHLKATSPCLGKGPASAQPGGNPVAANGQPCTIWGTTGDDVLVGTAGADVLCGLGGNDTIRPGAGNDFVDGGDGLDTVSYSNATGGATVNLTQQAAWDAGAGAIGWDPMASIERATGSPYADTIVGSPGADVLDGGNGADHIYGYDGNDLLLGGKGVDTLDGGNGTDVCTQGAGRGTSTNCEA